MTLPPKFSEHPVGMATRVALIHARHHGTCANRAMSCIQRGDIETARIWAKSARHGYELMVEWMGHARDHQLMLKRELARC